MNGFVKFAFGLVTLLFVGDVVSAAEEKSVTVSASSQTETSISVRKGDTFEVHASGSWKMGGFIGLCDVDGFAPGEYTSYNILRSANHGSLIVRCGSGEWQEVGSHATITADADGKLTFSPNDRERGNNSGGVEAKVTYGGRKPPPPGPGRRTTIKKELKADAEGGTSDIAIKEGDEVEVKAKGTWKMGDFIGSCDADGMDNVAAQAYNLVKNHLHGKLLVKVAGDDGWYAVGSSGRFTAKKSGNLMWSPNDMECDNNSGALTVTVTISRVESGEKLKDGGGSAKVVNVRAASSATKSGIQIRKGQLVQAKASGTWKMGPIIGACDADGMTFVGDTDYNLVKDAKHGILLAKVEGDDGWYAVGSKREFRAEVSGELIFAPNDNEPDNNSGSLSVTVTIKD